ncbi:30S ribosomal protein S2 [Bacteroidota bacterium]|nr:30S ribosomal protein S2 [Bacteroidota bacterium]MDC3153452.1 30S ribosomal protein S2 [Bacteroidota bacterium]MDC3230572.1 30S ribosomal protein S2 [Bacteroidota bacterium]|tara:strand:- start:2185 stop:2937 length:753 start_codon:yes stop_codon:yes gene_type:complete
MKTNFKELLEAGVHFGHLKKKWNPKMSPYVFMEKNKIHIIDLNKTISKLDEACRSLKQIAKSGKKILFVATKKQAKTIVAESAKSLNMPYITERWPGGLLTNFSTIRKSIKKMNSIDNMKQDGTFDTLSKREKLQIERTREKLELNFGSIENMNRIPEAIFVVDINKEHIAVAEANKLGMRSYAMVDTNTNPKLINFPIPANDDSTKSISKIMEIISEAVAEGLSERSKTIEENAKIKQEKAKEILNKDN